MRRKYLIWLNGRDHRLKSLLLTGEATWDVEGGLPDLSRPFFRLRLFVNTRQI